MAYDWQQGVTQRDTVQGWGTTATVVVVEEDVGAGDTWGPISVPVNCTLTLVEVVVDEGGEGVTGCAPLLGTDDTFSVGSINGVELVKTADAALKHRIEKNVRLFCTGKELYGRSRVAGGRAARILTRISWVTGHR